MGLEPMTSPLPRECSTTELHQPEKPSRGLRLLVFLARAFIVSRPRRLQHDADQKHGQDQHSDQPNPARFQRKPRQRQQPEQQCPGNLRLGGLIHGKQPENCGAQGRIRTSVARKERQIYSLLPLTTRPPVPIRRSAVLSSGGRQHSPQSCNRQDFFRIV